jgi:hypothetical protein
VSIRLLDGLPEVERHLINEIIDSFGAVLVERAPVHHHSKPHSPDWTNDGGRRVCGVCHPNVREARRPLYRSHGCENSTGAKALLNEQVAR